MKKGLVKNAIFVLSILSFFILSGCGEEEAGEAASVFKGGVQGLVAQFEPFSIEEEGIYTIFDSEGFPIEIIIRNKGENDIAPGEATVTLKGINLGDFNNIASEQQTNKGLISKVSEFNPEGGEEIIDFTPSADATYKPKVTGFFQPDIFALVEYDYKTRLIIPQVCFKEDLQDDSICDAQESKDFFVSGAPVTVIGVEQDVAGKGIILLTITIENVGGGEVTLPGEDFARYDQLGAKIETETEKWECRSGGRVDEARLIDGKAVIICKLKEPLEKGTLFRKQVDLTLDYRYKSIIQETLKIKETVE